MLPLWAFCCLAGFPLIEQQQTTSSFGELREAQRGREGLAICFFVVLVEIPIMKDLQVASSACELREDGQAGTDVAILGFLPSSRRSHYGGAAGRFHVANCPRLSRPGKVLPLCFFCCLASVPIMEEQQAGSSAGELHGAEQARERCCNFLLSWLKFPLWRSSRPARALASCARVDRLGKVLPFWALCRLASVPIMEEQQAASSAGELRGTEQAGEGLAILGFLLFRWGSHHGRAASRF